MTARRVVVAASVGIIATMGCSKQSTGTTGSTHSSKTSVSMAARPTGNVDIASAVRQWWQRVASISESRYFDARLCGLKQPGKIWLLGGGAPKGKLERSCALPANLPILAPVDNYLGLAAETPYPVPTLSPNQIDVTLDGKPLTPIRVMNSRPYRIISAAPGNSLGLRDGMRVIDGGYWVLINPGLPPGRHQLNIRASDTPARLWTLVAS